MKRTSSDMVPYLGDNKKIETHLNLDEQRTDKQQTIDSK